MPSKAQPASPPEKSSAMAEPILKLAPEQKGNPGEPAPAGKASTPGETGPKPFEDPVKEVKGRADAS